METIIETNALDSAKVGDGATINAYSDRRACTIVKRTDKKIWIQRDKAILLNAPNSGEADALNFAAGGFFGHTSGKQRYEYVADPTGEIVAYSRRTYKSGYDNTVKVKYVRVGDDWARGESISEGRHEYYDFNF